MREDYGLDCMVVDLESYPRVGDDPISAVLQAPLEEFVPDAAIEPQAKGML